MVCLFGILRRVVCQAYPYLNYGIVHNVINAPSGTPHIIRVVVLPAIICPESAQNLPRCATWPDVVSRLYQIAAFFGRFDVRPSQVLAVQCHPFLNRICVCCNRQTVGGCWTCGNFITAAQMAAHGYIFAAKADKRHSATKVCRGYWENPRPPCKSHSQRKQKNFRKTVPIIPGFDKLSLYSGQKRRNNRQRRQRLSERKFHDRHGCRYHNFNYTAPPK